MKLHERFYIIFICIHKVAAAGIFLLAWEKHLSKHPEVFLSEE